MERPDDRAEKAQADGAGEFGNSIILFPDEKAQADGAGESGNRIIREKRLAALDIASGCQPLFYVDTRVSYG